MLRNWVVSAMAMCAMAVAPQMVSAQPGGATGTEMKTVAVVGFAGVDLFLEDVKYVGKLAEMPDLAQKVDQQLAALGSPDGKIPGIDPVRPAGVVVQTDGIQFYVYGCIPVTDLAATMKLVEGFVGPLEPADGVYTIDGGGQQIFVTEKDGWAIVANDQNALNAVSAPGEPLTQAIGQEDIVAKVWIQNVPEMFRQMGLALLQQGIQQGLQQEPDESDEMFAARQKMMQMSIQQWQQAIQELDTLSIGLSLDESKGDLALTVVQSVLPDTDLAKQIALNGSVETQLSGFVLPDAALALRETVKAETNQIEQAKGMLDFYLAVVKSELNKNNDLSKKERKIVTKLVDTVANGMVATFEKGTFEIATSLSLTDNVVSGVGACTFAASRDLEAQIKDLLQQAMEDDEDLAQYLKLNAESYKGFDLHVLSIPSDEAPKEVRQVFGEKLEVVVAFSDDLVTFAVGSDGIALLKKAIDDSEAAGPKKVPPVEAYLKVKPVLDFAAAVTPDSEKDADFEQLMEAAQKLGDNDRVAILVTVDPANNANTTRISVEEDLLKMLGAAVKKGIEEGTLPVGPGVGPGPGGF
ncbi:MAG: hypothetical protein D6741_06715 [Planctomycetota bacterium]|nr:MAG: hypothetical protein D6741_06715 [Planctomycetota bacterium]